LSLGAVALLPAARVWAQTPPLLSGPAADPAQPSTLKTRDNADRMAVSVSVNGAGPYQFVVDTASNRTSISQSLAATLSLPAGAPVGVHSATGLGQAPTARIQRLTVGAREVADITAPMFLAENIGADGLLGIDALADQAIIMDFRAKRMTIQPSSRKENDPEDIVINAKSRYGQLILVDASVDGVDLYVIIDTGAEVSVGNETLRKFIARRRSAASLAPVSVISVTGAAANADMSTVSRVRLGGITVSNMPIAYADLHTFTEFGLKDKPSILLGMDVLRTFQRVLVDFKARQVRFLLAKDTTEPGAQSLRFQ
jgi:predicted aspartyl protease